MKGLPLNSEYLEGSLDEWLLVQPQERFLDTRYIPSLAKRIPKPLASLVCQALTINDFLPLHAQLPPITEPKEFAESILEVLQARVAVEPADLEKIPGMGAAVIVCNHPFGGLDGIALIAALLKIRPDARFLVNSVLGIFPDLRKCCLPLEILSTGSKAKMLNRLSLKMADGHLAAGGILVVFPSGTVSHWQLGKGICDPRWQNTAARLAQRNAVPVIPVFFPGRNSLEFQTLGLIHPFLRTLLLPREVKKRMGSTIRFTIGNKIEPRTFKLFATADFLTAYLRARCYDLRYRQKGGTNKYRQPVAAEENALALAQELESLPEAALLVSEGAYRVYLLRLAKHPLIKAELGRVRELTFRLEGEGSGSSRDLDAYDEYYEHLLLWHAGDKRLIGGYRLLQTAAALQKSGARALYTHSLFHMAQRFFRKYADSLELGRAFVHPDYQTEYQPLLLLWKGIGRYLLRYPHLRWLYGPVSLSLDYTPLGLATIIRYFKKRYENSELSSMVRGRSFSKKIYKEDEEFLCFANLDYNALSNLVREIDGQKGIPILFKHYLKMGGELASFHRDREFHTVDAFLFLDLVKAPRAALERYFTPEGARQYLQFHELQEVRRGIS